MGLWSACAPQVEYILVAGFLSLSCSSCSCVHCQHGFFYVCYIYLWRPEVCLTPREQEPVWHPLVFCEHCPSAGYKLCTSGGQRCECYLPHLSAGQLQFFCCCLFNPQWEIGPQPTHTKPSYPLQLLPCSLHTVDLCLLHSRLHVFLRSLYISFLLRVPMKWLASYAVSRFSPCVPSPAPTTLNFHKSEASARPEAAGVSTVTQKSAALPAPVLTVNGHESHAWVLCRDCSDQMCEQNHKVSFSLKCCNVLMKHSSIALFKSATESFRDVLLLL